MAKIKSLEEWGRQTARERYTHGGASKMRPASEQAPEFPSEQHGPKYDNDVPLSGWLRGTDATKKPGFLKPSMKR